MPWGFYPTPKNHSKTDFSSNQKTLRSSRNSVLAVNIDPVFKDYEYPDAEFDGTFSMGNTVSVSYFSQDDFSEVVKFYNQKFLGTGIQSGTSRNFSKKNPDGSYISATISPVSDKTQIILKLEK